MEKLIISISLVLLHMSFNKTFDDHQIPLRRGLIIQTNVMTRGKNVIK